jgi:8-oxo-dGTP pyrophosphatase MutT (NUDIX family)
MIKDKSIGIIPFSRARNGYRFLLVKQNLGDWIFPKGHSIPGEADTQTVVRELFEETNISNFTIVDGFRYVLKYFFDRNEKVVEKRVVFFLGLVDNSNVLKISPKNSRGEVVNLKWLPYKKALKKLTYKNQRTMLKEAYHYLINSTKSILPHTKNMAKRRSQNIRKNLTIGIPIRNEEKALPYFLPSLYSAINEISTLVNLEAIFCINASIDSSLEMVKDFQKRFPDLDVKILESAEGKIQAQQHIINSSELNGPIAFIDSDILLDQNCLKKLWIALNTNKDLQVAFARVYPVCNKKSLLGWWQKAYYEHDDDVRDQRMYIHGRAYILKDQQLFIVNDLLERINKAKDKNPYGAKYFDLEKGPLADDVLLSRLIAHTFGISAVKEIDDAIVYFVPSNSIRDCYEEQKRLFVEIVRNNLLFPDLAYTQEKWFIRKLRWRKLKSLGWQKIIHYLSYLPLVFFIKGLVRCRLSLGRKIGMGYGKLWKPTLSTKHIQTKE